MTHRDRDEYDTARGVAYLMATSENTRCRCDYPGEACRRFADREDLLCEWCREHKGAEAHTKVCYEFENAFTGQTVNAFREALKGAPEAIRWQAIGPG